MAKKQPFEVSINRGTFSSTQKNLQLKGDLKNMADSADMKFLNVCRRLLDIFKAETRWKPSNPRLALTQLETKLESGYPVASSVTDKFAAQQIVVNNRQDIYAKIAPFAKSARRYLRSCGATENEVRDGNVYINDLLGQTKKKPAPPGNTDAPLTEATAKQAKAQLSFDAQHANLQGFRAFAGNVTAYKPNEEELKLEQIDVLINECGSANNAVSAGFVPLSSAWNERDEKLYTGADSIIEDFRIAKDYYKSLYNPKDPQYKTITAKDLKLNDNSRR
jgi:hypothetical protein